MSTPIITEEWLTIPDVSTLFDVSEKQVRRIIKKNLKAGRQFVKKEKAEGKLRLPNGTLIDAYMLYMSTQKCYDLWEVKPNIVIELEKLAKKGRHIETTFEKASTPTEEVSTPENKEWVDKDYLTILKESRARVGHLEKKNDQWADDYKGLVKDYQERNKELAEKDKWYQALMGKVIEDARNTKKMLKAQINYLQKQLHEPEKAPKAEEGEFKEKEEVK